MSGFDDEGYLGKRLQDLMTLAQAQMLGVHREYGLIGPVEGTSTLHELSPGTRKSLADIARALGQSHQLIAQRLQKLLALGLATKEADPNDGRRSQYRLTALGEEQWRILDNMMDDVAQVNRAAFAEIGHDLNAALEAMQAALKRKSYRERFDELRASEGLLSAETLPAE